MALYFHLSLFVLLLLSFNLMNMLEQSSNQSGLKKSQRMVSRPIGELENYVYKLKIQGLTSLRVGSLKCEVLLKLLIKVFGNNISCLQCFITFTNRVTNIQLTPSETSSPYSRCRKLQPLRK